jgi:hypothetical protein
LENSSLTHVGWGGPGEEEERLLSIAEIDDVPGSIGTDTKHSYEVRDRGRHLFVHFRQRVSEIIIGCIVFVIPILGGGRFM